jgi:alpha-mannosidase
VWRGPEKPEQWSAETVERLFRHKHYKMGLNLGAQTYEWSPGFAARIRDWLARFPDRLYITGGDYAQPTACVRTGESNLRQLLYGLEVTRDALEVEVSIWTVSEPGNFSQLPQILVDLGYRGALMRIHGPGQGGSLTPRADAGVVWWEGPDGTRIVAVPEYTGDRPVPKAAVPHSMWIMTRYRNTKAARGSYTLDDLWAWKEAQAAKGITPVVMSKDDDQNNQYANNNLCMTSGHLLAADTEHDERFRWVTAEELFDELPEPERVFKADPNLFETRKTSFCDYGYRENADWLADFQGEAALRLADLSTVLAARLRASRPGAGDDYEARMAQAWKSHLIAQNHDLSLKGSLRLSYHLQYEAQRLAGAVLDDALGSLLGDVDTGSGLGAAVVLNPLGWDRTDYAQIVVPADVAAQGCLYEGDELIPWEVVKRDAERVVMGFVAHVPALGYRTYLIRSQDDRRGPAPVAEIQIDAQSLRVETDQYAVQFAPEGGLEGVWTKGGVRVAGPHSFALAGDIGDRACRSQGQVRSMQAHAVSARVCEEGRVGPYYCYQMNYRFVNGIPYIACDIAIWADFRDGEPGAPGVIGSSGRKLGAELCLPQAMGPISCMRKQPFLVWPYSADIDPVFAGLYWADFSGPQAGVALLNRGTIGHRWDVDRRKVSCLLATGPLSDLQASLGLLPHDGAWLEGGAHQAGLRFGHPLYGVYEPSHPGRLPRQFQLARIAPDTVTVSSVFCAQGKSYLRLFEHAGRSATLQIDRPDGGLVTRPVNLRLEPIDREPAIRAHQLVTLEIDG